MIELLARGFYDSEVRDRYPDARWALVEGKTLWRDKARAALRAARPSGQPSDEQLYSECEDIAVGIVRGNVTIIEGEIILAAIRHTRKRLGRPSGERQPSAEEER